jgi:membrane protein required for colicin V production
VAWVDWALLAVIALSVAVGLLRGFIKEVFSLGVWIAAFLVAFQYSGVFAEWLQESVSLPSARTALAFGGLFLAVLVVGGLLTYLLGELVEKTGLSGTDRLLGGVFGAARGVMLAVSLLLVAGFTPLPLDPWWQESRVIQALMPLVEWVAGWLPDSISQYLDLHPQAQATSAT